jgi:hypothetical protein
LDQVIFPLATDDARFSADIRTNSQIDLVFRKGLAYRHLVGIAHRVASNPVDPEYFWPLSLGTWHRDQQGWFRE